MAFYNCTSVGCLSANTGTYSTLSNCQANCVSWGCPPGLSANTKIYFIYDSSGSYGSSLEVMYTAATAYTNSLQSNGWQGESYHILNDKQTWLYWPTAIYKHDLVKASPTCNAVNGISSQYMNDFHIFDVENNNIGSYSSNLLQSSNGTPAASCYCPGDPSNIVGGGVKKAEYDEDIIVVAIINEDAGTSNGYYAQGWRVGTGSVGTPSPAPDYGNSASGIGPKGSYVGWYTNHYITYSGVTNAGGSLKSVLMPRQSAAGNPYGGDWDESTGWTPFERKFLLFTTAAISSGNQDNINAGGTGVLDGTWISGTAPGSAFGPEAICALGETQISDPNIEGNYTGVAGDNNTPKIIGLEISNPFWDLKGNDGTQYTSSDWYPTFTGMPAQLGPDPLCTFLGHNCFDDLTDAGVPFTSSPSGIFGGLDQYGWSIDTSFSGATAGDIGDVLTNMVGWFPGVIPNNCTSAETSGNVDYPYGDQTNCELLCFGAQLPVFTYNCGPNGCQQIPGTGGTYQNLSACTASCTSYTCTVTGCTSTPGTGGTTTLSACTASCVHYECTTHWGCCEVVTSPTNINNPSLDYIYQTSGACEEGCIGWRCNNDLGLTPDTKIYVFYDTTSMAPEAIIEAYWGLQSFLANQSAWVESDNGGITGGTQQHMTVANERWLTWPLMAYGFNLPDGSSYFDWTIMTQNSGNNLGNNLPPTTNNYVTQAWNWIYGITPPPASHPNYPNPDHWAIAAGNPMGGTNEGGIGQQSLLSLINTNPNNPNYGMNATINPQFWVNTATTTDKHGLITGDTLVIIFADESEGAVGGQYHTTSYTAAYDNSAPTPAWKSDYGNYSKLWRINEGNSATTTCSASTKLNLRTFIYPTKGLNGVTWSTHRPFPINVLAAVSVGNKLDITGNTPFDGTWITGTAPCPVVGYNAATGGGVPGTNWNEYFSAPGVWNGVNSGTGNKPIAFMEMANGLESSNNYFTANNPDTFYYSAGTGSSINNIPLGYGGLEFLGFGTNISYPIIDGSLFAQDLTQFLQESTNNQSGTCVSAQTRVVDGGNYPYLAESACTASCVSYSCSANGCIEDPTYGTFESLSACTAICQSYTCTTTGCSVYNVPYFDINGWTDYSNAWGSGGTYFIGPNAGTVQGVIDAQLSCTTDCNTFYCTNDGCLALPGHQNPTGNAYSTLSACTSACTSFNCDPTPVTQLQGYPNFVGTIPGCDPIPNASGQYTTQNDCQTGCTTYECGLLGCYQVNSQYGTYQDLPSCTAQCQSTECTDTGCVNQTGSGGTFFNQGSFATATAQCASQCLSYECGPTGCTSQAGTGGTYTDSNICAFECISFNCTGQGCVMQNGSGGTFSTLTACTASCTSWECGTHGCYEDTTGTGGTYSTLAECEAAPCTSYDCSTDGCILFNQPPATPLPGVQYYGTGGQYATSGACSAACIGFECVNVTSPTDSGCVEIEGSGHTYYLLSDCTGSCKTYECSANGCVIQNNSGGTYPYTVQGLAQCQTACTSYNCGANDCTPVVGSGGTYFNSTNSFLGYTACTASCSSFNCYTTGCTIQVGTGGTFSAMSSCTASCTSWECTTDCCQLYNAPYYGTGGTHSTQSACTAACIHWGCHQIVTGITTTTSKIYAYYDMTSMSQDAVKQAILAMRDWVASIPGFSGNLYHTLINDERWLGWATSVYTGAFADGNTSSTFDNANAGLIYQWAQSQVPAITGIYDNCIAGTAFPFLVPQVLANGPAPTAANTDDVIVVTFIDESARPNFGPGTPANISDYVYHGDDIGCGVPGCIEPQYAGLVANQLDDQVTETWRKDYTAFTTSFNAVTAATGTFNGLMYPTNSSSVFGGSPISDRNRIFALHVVACIDKGTMTPGAQGQNWLPGTAPRTQASGGMSIGTPTLCEIADLTALEVSNPYVLEGYGNLRDKGWNYNIGFSAFTQQSFDNDITDFLSQSTTAQGTGGTQCISACTQMTSLYPYATFGECTGNCISYECTINGCVVSPNTGGTFSSLAACTGDCVSFSCTTTGTTSLVGTGATGTHTDYNVIASGCNSFNCLYDPSSPSNQQGCQQQIGSGGTYLHFSSCTAECRSWECTTDCLTNATGCTEHPNTGHTYSSLSACTGSCQIDWYCVPEVNVNSCSGQQILGPQGGLMMNYGVESPWVLAGSGYGALGWMAENDQYSTFGSYSFSMSEQTLNANGIYNLNNLCSGPYVLEEIPGIPGTVNSPGYLAVLNSIVFTASGNTAPNFPQTFTTWNSLVTFFMGLGANINSSMYAYHVIQEIVGPWAQSQNSNVQFNYSWSMCTCLYEPCYTLCDNGVVPIPPTAVGPFTSSGAAETSCCFTATTWNCSAGTILDTCSARTQIDYPNQFANATDAWDWLTVNAPSATLDSLKYESTTPAFGVDDACAGPNGGILYEILPMSSPYVNNNLSYATWDGFIAQLQAEGVTGILSGMSFSIVNSHFMAQSGHSLPTCVAMCTCREEDCHCVEVIGTGGTYTTSGECYSACCSATTATSWNCASEGPMQPICSAKTYMGTLDSPWAVLDNYRQNAPASYFAGKKYIALFDEDGLQTPTYTWNDVWGSVSATSYDWQDCYKDINIQLGWPFNTVISGFKKINYVESISHPLVTGGFQYHNWNDFYTAAASVTTLNTNMTVSGVCTALSNIVGTGSYDCDIITKECCSSADCYCYELFTSGGTYLTEPDCISACCPTTGWTCYYANGVPQGTCINVQNPIPPFYMLKTDCEDPLINTQCFPETSWQCITGTTIYSCDPSIDLYTDSPAISANSIEYPFTSTTTDLNGIPSFSPPQNLGGVTGGNNGQGQVETILTDFNYLNPTTHFSSVTFEYCSGSTASCTGTTNCFPGGSNVVYGANNYPTYRMISISHMLVHDYTPYPSWDLFITAAQGLGHQVTTAMTSQFLWLNTVFNQGRFIAVIEPCTCYFDADACECIEVPNSNHYPTSAACEQVCCPSGHPITYDCTINGCVDPGNGTGAYNINQYVDCVDECQEWVCQTGTTLMDSCSGQTILPPGGGLLPQYVGNPLSPFASGGAYDALQYFAQSTNGLQGATFGTYKWDCAVGCSAVWGNIPPCSAPNGTWVKLVSCFVRPVNYTAGQANTPLWNGPYTNWFDTLTDIQNNGYAVNSVLNLLDVQTILTGSTMTNTNTCSNKTSVPVFGGLEELIVYISDPANGLQNTDVSTLVYDLFHSGYPLTAPVNNPPQVLGNSNVGQWNERCEALNQNWPGFGTWPNPQAAHRGHIGFFVVDFCDGNGGQQFTRYTDFISYMNISMPSLGVTLNTPFAQMKSLLMTEMANRGCGNMAEALFTHGSLGFCQCTSTSSPALEIVPVWETCVCAEDPCGCVLTPGTGHTSGFSITQSATCEQICCSSTCVVECGVLITGSEEGVLYYDHVGNTTHKLFDDIGFDNRDIAARQNKLWTYDSNIIKEYDVTWCPFSHAFNRNIGISAPLGKGLTPTNNPNILLAAGNYVTEIDISGAVAISTNLYPIPSGLTCTGDILWDESPGAPTPGHTIITFGSGSTHYVGKFTHPGGTLLEYSLITGLNPNERMDSLYGVSDVSTQLFGITTERRVFELLTNTSPLQFAPVATQTLTLVNQLTNIVNGATNVFYGPTTSNNTSCTMIESGDAWWCQDVVGCQSYPGGTIPPVYAGGPFPSLIDCQTQCNFGCGCSVLGNNPCACELTTTLVNPATCTWYPTLALCQAAQPPVGLIQAGSGCCSCYDCTSLTYQTWITMSTTVQQTISTNPIPAGGVPTWVNGQSYYPGEVVLFTDPYGNECCYVRVLDYCGNNPCPHDFITPWDSHTDYTNSLTTNTYVNQIYIPWIACDRDCPTVITYDCISATTGSSVVDSSCGNRNTIPQQAFTTTSVANVNSIVGYISDPVNGLQYTNVNDIRYVLNNANSVQNPCTDTAPIAPPNSNFAWNRITNLQAQVNVNPNGATGIFTDTTWAGLVTQLANEGIMYNGNVVNLQMTNTEVFAGINQTGNGGMGYGSGSCPCTPGNDCYCQEVLGPNGQYVTSAACELNCCSGSTWSCDTSNTTTFDSCANAVNLGVQGLSFNPAINAIAGGGWAFWNGNFSNFKFEHAAPPVPGSIMGTYMGQSIIPLAMGDTPCPVPQSQLNGHWARIVEINCSTYPYDITAMGPYYTWQSLINALNVNSVQYGTGVNFTPSMTYQDVTNYAKIQVKWEFCVCDESPCRGTCIELFDGSGPYSTQAECLSACCPTYDCTFNGCVNNGNGLGAFSSLTVCEQQCQQYQCQSGSSIMVGFCANKTSTPVVGSPADIIGYFADSTTTPISPQVNNMQNATFSDYTVTLAGVQSPFGSNCPNEITFGFPPTLQYLGDYVVMDSISIKFTSGGYVGGPFHTWSSIIQFIDTQLSIPGASLTSTYGDIQNLLGDLSVPMTLDPQFRWCECKETDCDCILIPGTGATPYNINQYSLCYSACCDETYDCTINGCVPNNAGTGIFSSLAQCQLICVEYECVSGVTADFCEQKQSIPVSNCNVLPIGLSQLTTDLLSYFSNPMNGINQASFSAYKYDQTAPGVYNPNTPFCNGTMCPQSVYHYFSYISYNNGWPAGHQYHINTGAQYSWADFINALNQSNGVNNYLMVNYSPNANLATIQGALSDIPGEGRIELGPISPCICQDVDCHCPQIPGTGHTPTQNYYSTSASCITDCCEDVWYCENDHGNCECKFGTAPLGSPTYSSLLDCKQSPQNCCKNQWYDCPGGACVSLIPGTIGPYATPADCTAAVAAGLCEPDQPSYNCQTESPGPVVIPTCVPCIGTGCQYTPVTAAGAPFFGDALAQCQSQCEGENPICWKCCMNKFGQIYQLTLNHPTCKCPVDTVEVPCDGTGPCPYPVSCAPGWTYNWNTCQCDCDQYQSCLPGYIWDVDNCGCKPNNDDGPIDVTHAPSEMVVAVSDYYNLPIGVVAEELSKAVDKLEDLKARGFKGDGCEYCDDPKDGVCLFNGCLTLEDLEDKFKPTSIICYVDGLPLYNRPSGAEDLANRLGCLGTHSHMCSDGITMGWMACSSHKEAVDRFNSIKKPITKNNNDPELFLYQREQNKLTPKVEEKVIVRKPTSPFDLPATNPGSSGGGGTDNGSGGAFEGTCCEWCATGRTGTPPSGCYDYLCDRCTEDRGGGSDDSELPSEDRDRGGMSEY